MTWGGSVVPKLPRVGKGAATGAASTGRDANYLATDGHGSSPIAGSSNGRDAPQGASILIPLYIRGGTQHGRSIISWSLKTAGERGSPCWFLQWSPNG